MHQPFASRSQPPSLLPRPDDDASGEAAGDTPVDDDSAGTATDPTLASSRLVFFAAITTLALAVIGSLLWVRYSPTAGVEAAPATTEAAPPETTPTTIAPAPSVAAYQAIAPSLVWITTDVPPSETEADSDSEPGSDGAEEVGRLGTGFIVNADGLIATANHVVDGAGAIEVIFADGTTGNAFVEVSIPERDIALIRADTAPQLIVPAVMGGGVAVGEEVYAVGNPLGLAGSMSSGVVSGTNRTLPLPEADLTLEGLIQFDAAVNPGNSGGPLLDANGHVVGVVTALANPSGENFFVGLGFASELPGDGGDGGGGLTVDL